MFEIAITGKELQVQLQESPGVLWREASVYFPKMLWSLEVAETKLCPEYLA